MTTKLKALLNSFENTVFLKSRAMRGAGALGALSILTAMADEFRNLEVVQSYPELSLQIDRVQGQIQTAASAIQVGAQDIAINVYGQLVRDLPALHREIWNIVPADIRGNSPTDDQTLMSAAERALNILGLN
ncbi:MAG: hypothetical protein AAFR03_08120 [Pseudomonadota bacterium]